MDQITEIIKKYKLENILKELSDEFELTYENEVPTLNYKNFSNVKNINNVNSVNNFTSNESDKNKPLKFSIQFTEDQKYKRKSPSMAKELISKACGWGLGFRKLLDLTAGLGADAVFLSQVGFKVKSLERHPLLFMLLDQALMSARQKQPSNLIWQNLEFYFSDANQYLAEQKCKKNTEGKRDGEGVRENVGDGEWIPDVIYYDPMYPHSPKSALPGKEMQILRRLLGTDEADSEILKLAIEVTKKIVVVKRPIHAPEILAKPNRVYSGKQVRYDVYTHT